MLNEAINVINLKDQTNDSVLNLCIQRFFEKDFKLDKTIEKNNNKMTVAQNFTEYKHNKLDKCNFKKFPLFENTKLCKFCSFKK